MPGCVFDADGKDFDVSAFLLASAWREDAEIWHRGEPLRLRGVHETSGFLIGISDSGENQLDVQIRDSLDFLSVERAEIQRLAAFPGVESMQFRIGLFWSESTLYQLYSLPPGFTRLAGELGITVTLCVYATNQGHEP
jgi:hypothetical protein